MKNVTVRSKAKDLKIQDLRAQIESISKQEMEIELKGDKTGLCEYDRTCLYRLNSQRTALEKELDKREKAKQKPHRV